MYLLLLTEGITDVLWHAAPLESLLNVLKTGNLRVLSDETPHIGDNDNGWIPKSKFCMCFSRTASLMDGYYHGRDDYSVFFKVNGRLLGRDYPEGRPYDYNTTNKDSKSMFMDVYSIDAEGKRQPTGERRPRNNKHIVGSFEYEDRIYISIPLIPDFLKYVEEVIIRPSSIRGNSPGQKAAYTRSLLGLIKKLAPSLTVKFIGEGATTLRLAKKNIPYFSYITDDTPLWAEEPGYMSDETSLEMVTASSIAFLAMKRGFGRKLGIGPLTVNEIVNMAAKLYGKEWATRIEDTPRAMRIIDRTMEGVSNSETIDSYSPITHHLESLCREFGMHKRYDKDLMEKFIKIHRKYADIVNTEKYKRKLERQRKRREGIAQ